MPHRPAHVFGMVTTAASRHYTPVALGSLFQHTPLREDDHVILIDNDGDFVVPDDLAAAALTVVRPSSPQGFARNGNLLLAEARARGADLLFLNNDLVFTRGWLEPLAVDRRALLSPLSNAQLSARAESLTTQPLMDLEDYLGHEDALASIVEHVRASASAPAYRVTPSVAFFCIRIPRAVYELVGDFDERFGPGGGEDRDYAVRAWLAGIPQEFALQSYVLHFQGKSTWRAGETAQARAERDARYTKAFQEKWGAALTYAFLGGDWNLFRSDATIARLLDAGNYSAVVRRLEARPALDKHIARQQQARFAAVCCLYDDDSWLPAAVESVYDACDSLWFLVGERPWNGESSDQSELLQRVSALPDPRGKIRVVRGDWPDEAAQRNAGLQFVREAGADYCLVLDADEIYDPAQLAGAMSLIRQNPQVDCWRASCLTYWKSYRHRVDPPEGFAAPVCVRVGTGRFVDNRIYEAPTHMNLPADTLLFHHMSYARSDDQIRRKLATFGHAKEVVPGWYENVWRRWDLDRGLENLNPCWPTAYRRIVDQPYELLPPALRRLWDDEGTGSEGPAAGGERRRVSRGGLSVVD